MNYLKSTLLRTSLLLVGLLFVVTGFAVTRTATSNNGNWDNPLHWTPNGVPTAADDVVIPSNISNFTAISTTLSFNTLTIDGRLTIGGFTASSAPTSTISGVSITVNGELWTSETINLEADITFGGSAIWDIRSYNMLGINGTPTITLNAGALGRMSNVNNISNTNVTYTNVNFVNFGTFRKVGGFGGTHTFAGNFVNESTGLVETGNPGQGTLPYNDIAFSGTLLNKVGGVITSLSPTGTVQSDITITGSVTNDGTINDPSVVSGDIDGSGIFTGSTINVANGSTMGPDACLTVPALGIDGTLAVNINGPAACTDYGQQTVGGTIFIQPGSILDLNFGSFSSPGGGEMYKILDGATLSNTNNQFSTVNGLPAGMVVDYDVANGDVYIIDNNPPAPKTFISVQSGDWDDPTTWDINDVPGPNDDVTIVPPHAVDATGLTIEFATLNINGNPGGSFGNLLIGNGSSPAPTTNIQSSGSITINWGARLSTNVANINLGCDINVDGFFGVGATNITGTSGTPTITVSGTGDLLAVNGGTIASTDVVNFGTVRNNVALFGVVDFSGSFTNEGGANLLVAGSGRVIELSGTVLNKAGATMEGSSASLVLSGVTTNEGDIIGPEPITGTIQGEGSISAGAGTFGIAAAGTLGPDACLDITASDFQVNGTLDVNISGTTACTDYDQQTVGGSTSLGAGSVLNLNFGSFTPAASDVFTIISGNGTDLVSGAFNTQNGVPNGFEVVPDFPNPGDVSVRSVNFTPQNPLDLVVGNEVAGPGNTVTVPVTVNNFTDIAGLQGTIVFDNTRLIYQSVSSPNGTLVPDPLNPTFIFGEPGTGTVPSNSITFGWFELLGGTETLADDEVIMEITFEVALPPAVADGDVADVEIDGSTTALGYNTNPANPALETPTVSNGGVTIDASGPEIVTVTIASNNANDNSLATLGDDITLTFTTDVAPAVTPDVSMTKGGTNPVVIGGSGTSWTATREVIATGDDGTVTFVITVEDQYGNQTQATVTTDGTEVIVDTEGPEIVCPAVAPLSNDAGVCGAEVTYTTPVIGAVSGPRANDANGVLSVVQTSSVPTAGLVSGDVFPVGTTTVEFTATDNAGNTSTCSFDIVVNDTELPTVVALSNVTIQLDASGNGTLTVGDIFDMDPTTGTRDNCGLDLATRSVTPNTFDCSTLGAQQVTLSVEDVNGNEGTVTATITVENAPVVSISGAAQTSIGTPIVNTVFDISGDVTGTQTGTSFDFLVPPCNATFEIGGSKSNDGAAGVNVADAVRILRHFLQSNPFSNQWELIAADVDNSNGVNIVDAISVASYAIGVLPSLKDPNTGATGTSWVFIPTDYVFADPANPWSFDTRRTYSGDQGVLTGQDFTGVKLGDVNFSWDLNPMRTGAPEGEVYFSMEEQVAAPGAVITIPVRVRDFASISGYQYTLNWDPSVLSFEAVNDVALEGLYGEHEVLNGHLTTAWVDMSGGSVSLNDDAVAFELVFRVVGEMGASSDLSINSSLTRSMAVNDQEEEVAVKSEAGKVTVGSATNIGGGQMSGYGLSRNVPNPFDVSTTLHFSLGQREEVAIEIYNSVGQVVRSFRGTYAAGAHELEWDGRNASGVEVSEGVYFIRMQAGDYAASLNVKKMN